MPILISHSTAGWIPFIKCSFNLPNLVDSKLKLHFPEFKTFYHKTKYVINWAGVP